MPGKSHSVVVLCSTGEVFSESDEDLDLTDTKLLSSDDEKLKEYVEMHDQDNTERTVPRDNNYVDSLSFKPLTSSSSSTNIASSVVHKDSAIVLSEEEEAGGVPNSHLDDLPDYESPAEEEVTDIKYTLLGELGKVEPNNDDELPEIYKQDRDDGIVDDDDDIIGYDCFDEEDFYASSPCKSKVEKFSIARVAPYSIKDRHTLEKGKGKQPVSGPRKYKSSNKKTSVIPDSSKDLVCSDFGRPDCFEDDSMDTDLHLEQEEQLSVLAEPMVCESCSKKEGHNSMVQCCDGHVVCTKCVEGSAKKVLVGERKGSIECPQLECNSSVPMSELRKALPAIVLDLLEDKWNKETLEALENMKDVVKCPGCSFSAVLDISLKRFQCIQCNEAYCRYCEYKWNDRKTHDLCVPTKQWTSTVTGNVVNIPARWSEASEDGTDSKTESHIVVKLDTDSEEYLDVVHTMNKHMKVNVKRIYRVQNERLWEKYSLTRSHMVADLGELNINEKRLFHGTHGDVIEAICREGFDWRLCGKHGVVYGQGTYFAKSSVLSHRYSSGYSSSKKGINAFIGGLLFGASGRRPPSTVQSSVFMPQGTTTGITFGGTPRSTPSFGFTFGVPAATSSSSTPNSSSAGTASGGPAGGYNPLFQFGSTAASFSSGSDTNIKHSCPAHRKSKGTDACGHSSGTSTNLPAPAGLYTKSDTSSNVSSTTDDVSCSHYKRECQYCIFCTHRKKPSTRDPGKKGLDPNKYIFSIQTSSPAMQHAGLSGSGPAASGSGSASSGSGNADSTTDEATLKQQQCEEVRKAIIRNMFRNNTGAHLFMGSVSPSSGFVFPSGGSRGNKSHFQTGPRNNNSSANGGNGANNGRASGTSRLFGVDSGDDDSNDCYMFLARVLLGRSCLGTSNMRRPARNREGLETHSAVDQEQNPGVFVIFDNNQCYPEYIIQYSK